MLFRSQTVMIDKGIAHIGIGHAKGDEKALEAVKQAVASPLLETTIEGASHVIINISGDISLIEANEAASYVQELAGDGANIIFGAMYDENAQDEATITVIATGLDDAAATTANATATSTVPGFKKAAQPTKTVSAEQEAAATVNPYRQPQTGFGNSFKPQNSTENPSYTASPRYTANTQAAPQQSTETPQYRSRANRESSINIPDFLKNRK